MEQVGPTTSIGRCWLGGFPQYLRCISRISRYYVSISESHLISTYKIEYLDDSKELLDAVDGLSDLVFEEELRNQFSLLLSVPAEDHKEILGTLEHRVNINLMHHREMSTETLDSHGWLDRWIDLAGFAT